MPMASSAPRTAASANAVPPAAPVPGRQAQWLRPRTAARRIISPSIPVISGPVSPFCGPKTAAAPWGPVSGFVTSPATVMLTPSRRRRAGSTSIRRMRENSAGTGSTSPPRSSRQRAPSATSIPRPMSLEADPPSPMSSERAPASTAAAMTCPSPMVEERMTSRSSGTMCSSPTLDARSMTARSLSRPKPAVRGRPRASTVVTSCHEASQAAVTASAKPSPPSETGT